MPSIPLVHPLRSLAVAAAMLAGTVAVLGSGQAEARFTGAPGGTAGTARSSLYTEVPCAWVPLGSPPQWYCLPYRGGDPGSDRFPLDRLVQPIEGRAGAIEMRIDGERSL